MLNYFILAACLFLAPSTLRAQHYRNIEDQKAVALLDKLFSAIDQKDIAALSAITGSNVYCYSCTMKENSDAPFTFTQQEFITQQLKPMLDTTKLFNLAALSEEVSTRPAAIEEQEHADLIVYFFVTLKDSHGKAKEPIQLELHLKQFAGVMKWSGMGIVE